MKQKLDPKLKVSTPFLVELFKEKIPFSADKNCYD